MSAETSICYRCKVVMGPEDPSAACAMLYQDRHDNTQALRFSLCLNCLETVEEWISQRAQRQAQAREAARAERTKPSVH